MAGAPPPPIDLSEPRRLHVVGVGGPGMSAIAIVLAEMGHEVSGSDIRERSVLDRVRAAGVEVQVGHRRELVHGRDAITWSTAIPARNIERDEADKVGVLSMHRSGMLAAICARARSIGVAGTHGKTSTTSMLMLMLAEAGQRPSFVIGGDVTDMGTGAQWTGGEWLVVEADESDGTHLQLPLYGTILTNVEVDHLDHYGTFEAIVEGFDRYLGQIDGPKVLCIDDPTTARLAALHDVITYGTSEGADFRAVNIEAAEGSFTFDVARRGEVLGTVSLPLRGVHNVRNATGALAMAVTIGVPFVVAAAALSKFGGVARRFDVRGVDGGATLVDDYGHLPSEIAAVLAAARASGDGWKRVVAVFQPNRFNRIAVMWPDYHSAFVDADLVVLTEIYASGTAPIPGVTGKLLVNAVLDAHPFAHVVWLPKRGDLVEYLAGELGEGDVCISMGCGDIATLPDEVMTRRAELRARREASSRVSTPAQRAAFERLSAFSTADEPLAPHTTYKLGGPAAVFASPRDEAELALVGEVVRDTGLPVLVLGRGSNLLVADAGFAGIVVSLAAMAEWVEFDDTTVAAGGAVALPVLSRRCSAAGLVGFEWAVGVPGSIGGAVRMNAGGHGSDMAACLVGAHVYDLRRARSGWVPVERLGLRFRGSALADHQVVVDARLQLAHGDVAESEAALAEIVRWRREHQPGGQNAGSVFVNPVPGELPAALLIDRLGLRGHRVGGAYVSEKHANFIQAGPGATAADVRELMGHVREVVAEHTGHVLRSEVRLVGFPDVVDEPAEGVLL